MESERAKLVASHLHQAGYDGLICRLPENIVMLTGYQPILGESFAVISWGPSDEPVCRLAVPADEQDRVPSDAVAQIECFTEESLTFISDAIEAARQPLRQLVQQAGLSAKGCVIGYEGGYAPVATAYTQVGIPGPASLALLQSLLPQAQLRDAHQALDELRAVKTQRDLQGIQRCEAVAISGYEAARKAIHVGAREADVAAAMTAELLRAGYGAPGASHVLPFVHVMAGKRSAQAYKAFNLTSTYALQRGDAVLVQMELCINGYWCELTRTFFVGQISSEWQGAHEACIEAQGAALVVIRDGATGQQADAAARTMVQSAGFGPNFKHGLGHGFGFQAINHSAQPILHPASRSVLKAGMVHNMEPAVYIDGEGGIRLNDNVLVLADGNAVLSADLPRTLDWLVVSDA